MKFNHVRSEMNKVNETRRSDERNRISAHCIPFISINWIALTPQWNWLERNEVKHSACRKRNKWNESSEWNEFLRWPRPALHHLISFRKWISSIQLNFLSLAALARNPSNKFHSFRRGLHSFHLFSWICFHFCSLRLLVRSHFTLNFFLPSSFNK